MTEATTSVALPLGYSPVPAGHLASVVTYLEMRARPPRRDVPLSDMPPHVRRLGAPELEAYRALYRAVGERWLWFSRLLLSDAELAAILADPQVHAYAVYTAERTPARDIASDHDQPIGLLELDFRIDGEAELVFFGVTSDRVGTGIGRWLMEQALDLAWAAPISRLVVHTCTLDHPDALSFYERSGFSPYARAVEVAPDPRLTGALPRNAAPQVPLIETPARE